MKMLTGLLPFSEGEAWLLGKPVDPTDMAIRMRVGYMSQSFSLYSELTVRQNLAKGHQWGLPGYVASADVARAFEQVSHAGLAGHGAHGEGRAGPSQ